MKNGTHFFNQQGSACYHVHFFHTPYSNIMFKTEMLTHLRALDTLVEAFRGLNRKMTAFFLSGPLGFGQSRL